MLEEKDKVQPGDFCRPMHIVTMSGGHSDEYSFTCCYTGRPENHTKWVQVERHYGDMWMGNTVDEINNMSKHATPMEFIRGELPFNHIEPLTESEVKPLWKKHLDKLKTPKHTNGKGISFLKLYEQHRKYFEWCVDRGYVIDFREFYREELKRQEAASQQQAQCYPS